MSDGLFPMTRNSDRYRRVLKHLNPLFKRSVRDRGSPFAKSISNSQAAILMRDLEMPEIMDATLDNIMESINVAVDAGVPWAPWHLTGVLQKARLAAYKASRRGNRSKAVHGTAKQMVVEMDMNREKREAEQEFKAWKDGLTPSDVRVILDAYKKKLGTGRIPGAGMILRWEWTAKRETTPTPCDPKENTDER